MKKKVISGFLSLALLVSAGVTMIPAYTAEAETQGTTYYVSSVNGSDSSDGLSEDGAFETLDKINEITLQPGDRVLLEKGSVFNDQALHIKGSGTAEAPIEISVYGEGDRPQINANGHGQWEQDYGAHLDNTNHKWRGTVSSAILLRDVEYIEISGLEITNDRAAATDTEKGKEYNDPSAMDRTGVAGVAKDKGTVDHIVLDDLYIHDVTGNVYNKHMANGGIYFIVETPENESQTGIARYNDVQIRNCYLDEVNRWGIAVGYTYQWGQFKTAALSDAVMEKYGSSNVVIENNYVANAGGDAITTMYLDRPLVQYNVSQNAAKQINTTDYSKRQPQLNPDTGEPTGNYLDVSNQRVAAGIWPWKCKDAVFQYNECFNTMNASNGNGDGQPWDADYGDGTNYQYNYSHGNTASTVMFCGTESINNTFRYNISQNEDMGPLDPAGNTGNCHVYNNTFYIKEGLTSIWSTMHANNGPMTIENNIFYFAGDTPVAASNWNPSGNKVYDNNLYYNVSTYPNDENAVKVAAGTEVLADAGSGPVQAAEGGQARMHDDPNEVTAFDGYKLAENSPAVNAGKIITDQNGFEIEHDFFGHEITAIPEIGAAESDVPSLAIASQVYEITDTEISGLGRDTTLETFLANLIYDAGADVTVKDGERVLENPDIVKGGMSVVLSYGDESRTYTIRANADNELKETVYMTKEQTLYVPFTEQNPATAGEVLMNISVHETASAVIVKDGEELPYSAEIEDGDVLRITAENGDVNSYTIAQKNTYNWTMDYAGPRQGNVWFGQMKTGADGEWVNMTDYDPQYPNWQVNTYYGPGIDAPSHDAEITEGIHGLLSAPPNTEIYTAMAFRAPKSGTVSFNVKDDEPYLRQAGNTGGTVTLSLLLNDRELQSVTLAESGLKSEDWEAFEDIVVNKGDYIRVTVKSVDNPTKPSVHVTPVITYQNTAAEDTEAPTAPQRASVSDITSSSAKIMWDASVDNVKVAGYNIYIGDSGIPLNGDTLVTDTEYYLEGLDAQSEYTVKIEAVDSAGNKSGAAEVEFTTAEFVDREAPTAPADLKADSRTTDSITISWTASSDNVGVAGYKVLVNGLEKADVKEGTTWTLTGLEPGTEYTIVVAAYDAMGSQAASDALKVKTLETTEEEPGKDPDKDPDKEPGKDPGKEPDKDPGKEPGKDPGKETDKESGTGAAKEGDKAVKTGDASELSVWTALLISAGAVLTVRMRKRERQ